MARVIGIYFWIESFTGVRVENTLLRSFRPGGYILGRGGADGMVDGGFVSYLLA